MSGSNSKSSTPSGELTSGSSSSTIQRPLNPILAPSKLSFGVSGGTLGEKASSISSSGSGLTFAPSTKLAFPGLKASKLSSVTQSVCSNSKALDENKQPPVAKAANFIPLTKESSTKLGETNPLPTSSVSPTATECVQETEAASSGAKASSSSFVFGQNLNDRAANFLSSNGSTKKLDTSEEQVDNTNSESTGGDVIPAATVSNSDKAPKSLTESAAEYCESRSKKVELTEVDLITGEESEANVCQMNAKVCKIKSYKLQLSCSALCLDLEPFLIFILRSSFKIGYRRYLFSVTKDFLGNRNKDAIFEINNFICF